MGLLSFLSPRITEQSINTATTGIVRGVDALVFTAEEKSAAGQKALDTVLEFQKSYVQENTVRSMTRRILALFLVGYYCLLLSAALAFTLAGHSAAADAVLGLVDKLEFAFYSVVVTYFVPYQLSKIIKGGK